MTFCVVESAMRRLCNFRVSLLCIALHVFVYVERALCHHSTLALETHP